MRLPALGVFFHHSVTDATGDPAEDMRTLEDIGRARFGIFSYCYAVFPDGTIGEGAGLTVGAHTKGHNSHYIGIVFVGNYDVAKPTAAALAAAAGLLRDLEAHGHLVAGYTVAGHRDVKNTACPGGRLYPLIDGIHAAALTPGDDDMTPDQARKLDELHAAFIGNGKPPKPGAFRRVLQLVDARTWGIAAKHGVRPNPRE